MQSRCSTISDTEGCEVSGEESSDEIKARIQETIARVDRWMDSDD